MVRKRGKIVRTGCINQGIGHGIKKVKNKVLKSSVRLAVPQKRRSTAASTSRMALFSVQAPSRSDQDDVPPDPNKRFFRSRGAGRKPTVSVAILSKSGVRQTAGVRRGAGGDAAARRPSPFRDAVTASKGQVAGSPGQVAAESQQPRRSPRKRPSEQPVAAGTPPPSARRSPRKSCGLSSVLAAELGTRRPISRPTRLLLAPRCGNTPSPAAHGSPRRSPRKQQQRATPSTSTAVDSDEEHVQTQETAGSVEQLLLMDVGEDKENESPVLSPTKQRKAADPKFYSIFYKDDRKDGIRDESAVKSLFPSPKSAGKTMPRRSTRRSVGDSCLQMTIDAGQRNVGVTTCSTCGLIFTIGDEEDTAVHAKYHTEYLGVMEHTGWKRESVVAEYMGGRVLMIVPKDPHYAWKKVEAVLKLVDKDLGFVHVGMRNKDNTKVFLYVLERHVRACLVAERVSTAYRVVAGTDCGAPMRCGSTSQPCVVGVSRVWVHRDYRRQGIASRLVDAMRCNFTALPLTWEKVAFSDPTPDGAGFASRVTESDQFLVYNQ